MPRGILEYGSVRTEQVAFEERTSDPPNTEARDAWLRVDLAPETNQLATLRVDTGSGTWDVPVFAAGTSASGVEETLGLRVGGQAGYLPATQPSEASFPQLAWKESGQTFGLHSRTEPGVAIPDSGVSRYEFEQDVSDSWGDNDATDNSSAGYGSGQVGSYAKDFNGVDDYVDLPFVISSLGSFSVSAWVYARGSGGRFIDETPGSEGFWMRANDTWGIYEDGGGQVGFLPQIPLDTWFHAVLVLDENNEARAYIDGSLYDSVSLGSINVSSQNARLGAENDAGGDPFDGLIDDPRVYDYPLSDEEVSLLCDDGASD